MDTKGEAPPPQYQQQPPAGVYPPPPSSQYPPPPSQYPPPQYPPPPQQQQQQVTGVPQHVVSSQPAVQVVTVAAVPPAFREVPVNMQCQFCHAQVVSRTETENGLLVWLVAGAICLFGAPLFLFLGCCLIPLCIPSLKDVGHYCPSCSRKLGTYQRVR